VSIGRSSKNQVNQPGCAAEHATNCLSVNRSVAHDVDSLDLRDFPLVQVEMIATRLRSSGVTVVVTSTP